MKVKTFIPLARCSRHWLEYGFGFKMDFKKALQVTNMTFFYIIFL